MQQAQKVAAATIHGRVCWILSTPVNSKIHDAQTATSPTCATCNVPYNIAERLDSTNDAYLTSYHLCNKTQCYCYVWPFLLTLAKNPYKHGHQQRLAVTIEQQFNTVSSTAEDATGRSGCHGSNSRSCSAGRQRLLNEGQKAAVGNAVAPWRQQDHGGRNKTLAEQWLQTRRCSDSEKLEVFFIKEVILHL